MGVKETFEQLGNKMKNDPTHLDNLHVIYQFNLSGDDGGTYQLKIENQEVELAFAEEFKPNITLELKDNDFLKLAEGGLNPTVAYMSGKLKVKGDLSLALKLSTLIKKYQ